MRKTFTIQVLRLSSDEAEQQIDETLRRIGRHTDAVDWWRAEMQAALMANGCSMAISASLKARTILKAQTAQRHATMRPRLKQLQE